MIPCRQPRRLPVRRGHARQGNATSLTWKSCARALAYAARRWKNWPGADAFRSMGLERRAALWQIRGLADAAPLPLFEHAKAVELPSEPDVKLPPMPLSAHVLEDYRSTRLSLKAHPMSFLRPRLQAEKTVTCLDLGNHA